MYCRNVAIMLRAFWPGSLEKNNSMSLHQRCNKSQGCVNVGSCINSEVNNYHLEHLTFGAHLGTGNTQPVIFPRKMFLEVRQLTNTKSVLKKSDIGPLTADSLSPIPLSETIVMCSKVNKMVNSSYCRWVQSPNDVKQTIDRTLNKTHIM